MSPSRTLSYHPSIHPLALSSVCGNLGLPQSHRSQCSLQTSGTSSVSDLHSSVEQLRHELSLSRRTSSPSFFLLFPGFSPPPPSSCLVVFSSHSLSPPEGDYHLLARYFISKSLWLTIGTALLFFALSLLGIYCERKLNGGGS